MAQQFWQKMNANERMVVTGAIIVLVAWLVGAVSGGGLNWGFLFALGVIVVYYLKYMGTTQINWPVQIELIILVGAGIALVFSVLGLLWMLSWIGPLGFLGGFFIGALLGVLANAIGAAMMTLGAWREYQAAPKPTPPSSTPPSSTPPSA